MSKFNFEYMSNDENEAVLFNKFKWTKEKALEQAKIELDTDEELEVITSVVQFGFWKSPDGEVYNNWFCPNLIEPLFIQTKTQVEAWLVRIKELEKELKEVI